MLTWIRKGWDPGIAPIARGRGLRSGGLDLYRVTAVHPLCVGAVVEPDVVPSLLHGDLWSGNYAFDAASRPVVYDPACYYGDRETDLAMTTLFGGFSEEFYSAYSEYYPLDQGFTVRKGLYNFYHVLNHFNLFGGSYARQAENLCLKVLSEVR